MERWNKKLQNILKCQYKELTFLVGGGGGGGAGGGGAGGVCLAYNKGWHLEILIGYLRIIKSAILIIRSFYYYF